MAPQKINYQTELDNIITEIQTSGKTPTLLLHSCCGPCSSYVIEYLSQWFNIHLLYHNPSIFPEDEYRHRLSEQLRIIELLPTKNKVIFEPCEYDHNQYLQLIKGLENAPEGGVRCAVCFRERLEAAAAKAKELSCDWFCSTLTVSPHKNAQLINQIGQEVAKKYQISFLPSDFKKREGYKRSITLSMQYNLYRQNYCGCEFSYYL